MGELEFPNYLNSETDISLHYADIINQARTKKKNKKGFSVLELEVVYRAENYSNWLNLHENKNGFRKAVRSFVKEIYVIPMLKYEHSVNVETVVSGFKSECRKWEELIGSKEAKNIQVRGARAVSQVSKLDELITDQRVREVA
ncbi:MAG: hypothetical protein WCX73_03010 [Candidatus Pacearchaeota archaeon]|jgi:hypothetical protein